MTKNIMFAWDAGILREIKQAFAALGYDDYVVHEHPCPDDTPYYTIEIFDDHMFDLVVRAVNRPTVEIVKKK